MCKRFFLLISFLSVLAMVSTNLALGDVIEVRIDSGDDDMEELVSDGTHDLGSSDLEITEEGEPANNQLIGLRFNNVDIPQGATIIAAYVQFHVDETDVPGDNRPGTKFLRGEAVDNAATFTDTAFDIASRPTTSAEASWDWPEWLTEHEEGPDQQTSDIAAVIQEIVDRPGWSAGNSLALIITGSGENAAEAFEGEADAAALLHVEFEAAAAPSLPEGWQSQDIGTTGGSAEESDGMWAITADGADVWGSADEFHYAYMPLSGDGTIIAQVISNGEGSNGWAKGGVMIRETLDADSKHAIMALTGGEGGGMAFQNRQETAGSSFSSHGDPAAAPPYWVKLTRVGNTITGYSSADGVEWVQQPDGTGGDMTTNPVDIEMAEDVYIGLFVTSHASGELRTYMFDSVSVELPRAMDNWEGAAAADAPGFLATNVPDALYDIGAFSGDITYEFCVKSNPDETEASMCLIGRRQYGDTQAGLKFDQWNDTGEYGATLFGVVDLYYGVPYTGGVDTHLVWVSSEDAGTTALYENGVYKGSVDAAITLFGLVGIGYGAQGEDASGVFDDFDGDIYGVAIYDTALSPEKIAAHADAFLGRALKVNFQLAGGDVPAGYLPDYGEAFGDRGNGYKYGWSRDIQADARDRDIDPDQRYDTLIHLQKAENAVWEIELPNGTYNLFIVGGDPGYTDQINNFDVEGVYVPDPDGEDNFDEYYNIKAVVSDGRLTIQPGDNALNSKIMFVHINALVDVTAPGDPIRGVPDDGDWPGAETPDLAIDDNTATKYLHFKGDFDPDPGTGGAGFQVTPAAGPTIVTGLTLTTANDVPGRDPIAFELSGSNEGIDGPYELIASGDVVDFAGADEWPRFTMNATPILFENDVAYTNYQLIFTAIRGPVGGSVNSMQIAEVELLGVRAFPPAGPIAHWKLDDGEGTIAVDSSNGLDGILMGDPQWSAGVLDGALDFDGDGDYVDCGTNEKLNSLNEAITASAWLQIRSLTTAWMAVMAKGENAWRISVNGETTGLHFGFSGGDRGWQAANSASELPLNEWHHVTATYDLENGGRIYIDGVEDGSNPDLGGVQMNEMPFLIGENPEATGRFFDGLLDDIRIYDRVLSADEISQLAGNILANGGFENGAATPLNTWEPLTWNLYGNGSLEVVTELTGAAVPDAPIEGSYCLHVVVPEAGANFWDVGLQHIGHTFQAGKQYTLSAFLKCNQGTLDINFKPELGADPWTGYGEQSFTMTEEWTEFSVTTPVFDADVNPATITFHIAYAPGDFWVDGVKFVEVH